MTPGNHEPALDPQDLERLLIARQRAGDVEGMVALYEEGAVIDAGEGLLLVGREAIRRYFMELVAAGRVFDVGKQRPAVTTADADLALTSTRLPDGSVTAEIARRQDDGTWLWVVDKFSNE